MKVLEAVIILKRPLQSRQAKCILSSEFLAMVYRDTRSGERNFDEHRNGRNSKAHSPDILAPIEAYSLMLLSARRRENPHVLGVLKNQRVARLHEAQPPKFAPPTLSITTRPKQKLFTYLNMHEKALASMQPRFKEYKQSKSYTPSFCPPKCQDPKSWKFRVLHLHQASKSSGIHATKQNEC